MSLPPLEVLWKFYAITGLTVLLIVFTPLKNWGWKKWWYIFCTSSFTDYLSTLLFVYVYGLGWQAEGNEIIQKYGASFGYLFVLNLHMVVPVLLAYLVGCWLNRVTRLGAITLLAVFSFLNFTQP
ncbi:MAG: hypothetical protein HYW89_02105 [Candidatus Sungiibacteriota bacterium]|uniref:Uncharacterized protein n=1 Tax=Candidatus Sungiibacteriota bacterium TaxID=2750080 RepID=A0A7T5RKB3_9BACT|nr:MAG: hypothetical protein HYW89_02105 [Candidatus Sungbacteria bacterium]